MKNNKPFQPTFRKYKDMNDGEKAAFRQGATTVDNSVKERLGLKPSREQARTAQPPTQLKNSAAPKDSYYTRYQQVKATNKEAIVFYRLGDFYEVLGGDAEKISKALDLTLTSRSIGDSRIPMCGVPFHALDGYVAKLVQKGFKVATAD